MTFLAATRPLAEARWVLLGAPLDLTVSYRPGSRFAPARIREVSQALETYSPELDRDLEEVGLHDAGDLDLPPGNLEGSLGRIEAAVGEVAAAQRAPLLLGGEHLITLPAVRALRARFPDLAVIQFDAHADLRDTYLEQRLSHATVMRRLAEVVGPGALFQVGIRSGVREEFAFAAATHLYPGFRYELVGAVREAKRHLRRRPVYVTVDIDVVDPGLAPGTGTPEPGGATPGELLRAVAQLAGLRVVGGDVVEVSPPYDAGDVTSLLAARLVREMILLFGSDRGR